MPARRDGWIDGRNLTIEYRFSQPPDRLPASVADLIALSPDVLIAVAPQAAVALKSATATIPIVFVAVADPVGIGLVQSLSRPGGNLTGLATMVPDEFSYLFRRCADVGGLVVYGPDFADLFRRAVSPSSNASSD
jgi:putative ABC transport system substrate-binding protein